MPVAMGPHGQSQASCFDCVKMGFVMGCAMGMAAGVPFGNFSCLRIGMRGLGADGRHRKNHDAEWQHLCHIHGHRDGHLMLIRAVVAHNMHPLPSVPSHLYYNKASLWVKNKKRPLWEHITANTWCFFMADPTLLQCANSSFNSHSPWPDTLLNNSAQSAQLYIMTLKGGDLLSRGKQDECMKIITFRKWIKESTPGPWDKFVLCCWTCCWLKTYHMVLKINRASVSYPD